MRPRRSLGQHFLIDPNLARAIVADAEVGPGDRVVEIGAGLGSLTVALARAGARVLAIEVDPRLVAALRTTVGDLPGVRVLATDATRLQTWTGSLVDGPWTLCANLPYGVATPIVLGVLERVAPIRRLVVMVQREVAERLVAGPGEPAYGAPSLRVAYHARAALLRRVPATVFWPRPAVESAVVRLDRRDRPPVAVEAEPLWRVVEAGFAQRRKTLRSALRRLGADPDRVLAEAGVAADTRAEQLDLEAFARLAAALESAAASGR
ncbi:MAG: ribosomal RNA small subunit methyltransferase A [Actinomycetota bacterium]|nr:MAG: ribosomal RNA small subunit methyltransferase A [Actinomycetota bacterium]